LTPLVDMSRLNRVSTSVSAMPWNFPGMARLAFRSFFPRLPCALGRIELCDPA
jgi:hypothetical protein